MIEFQALSLWGRVQIKFNQMHIFEERGKPLRAKKSTFKLNPHMMLSLEIKPRATLVGGKFSHHYTISALISANNVQILFISRAFKGDFLI